LSRQKVQTLKRLIPLTLLAALTACAVPSPAPGSAGPMSPSGTGPALLVREQADPPQPLLEHPGKPPANGYLWIAGRWDLLEGRYHWQPGNWVAPRPDQILSPAGPAAAAGRNPWDLSER